MGLRSDSGSTTARRTAYDRVNSLAVDGCGNVVVTGTSYGDVDLEEYDYEDYYTAKYAAANGALLWAKRYNGPADGYDVPYSIAVSHDGMVAVTGSTSSGFAAFDFATVVYRENLPPKRCNDHSGIRRGQRRATLLARSVAVSELSAQPISSEWKGTSLAGWNNVSRQVCSLVADMSSVPFGCALLVLPNACGRAYGCA